MIEEGPTEPSGLRDETECPSEHWDLKPGEACISCHACV